MRLKSMTRNNLLRQQELADALGTTAQTIVAWEKEGLPPFYRKGTFVLYDIKRVERWLYKDRSLRRTDPGRWRKNTKNANAGGKADAK